MTASSVATNVFAGTIDLVTRLDARREQPEPKRVEPAREADAVRGATVGGERALELRDLRPVRERARLEQLGDLLEELIAERRRTWAEVEEGHAERRRGTRCDRHRLEARGRVNRLPRA